METQLQMQRKQIVIDRVHVDLKHRSYFAYWLQALNPTVWVCIF